MSGLILFLLVLVYTLTCLFVILTVLLQSGKGGGLSSLGSGAGALSDSLGATGAEKTLVKVTSWGSGIFLALSMLLTLYGSHLEKTGGLAIGAPPSATQTAPAPSTAPAEAPAAGQPVPAQPAEGQSSTAPAAPAEGQPVVQQPAGPESESKPAPAPADTP